MLASLAGLLIALYFLSKLALTAILEFSRSRFEKLYATRRPELMRQILTHDDETVVALRAAGWLFLVIAAAFASLAGRPTEPAPPPGWWSVVEACALAWVLLIGMELWVVRPLGKLFAEPILYWAWPALRMLRVVLMPVVTMHGWTLRGLNRLAGRPENGDFSFIEEEIRAVVNEGEREGSIEEHAADMIEGLIELHEVAVSEIMTPRTDMEMLKRTATIEEARQLIRESGHSRIPVYEESRDEISGVLYAKDLLPHLGVGPEAPANLAELKLRKPVYVPESKRVDVLLQQFRRERVHIAIVLDEYGGVAGLVTIEDIIEEIVGEIADEHDQADEPPILKVSDNLLEVDARIHVDELNEVAPVDLPENADYDTVGGFLFSALGHIPKVGESFEHHGATFTVLDASDRAINRVRIECHAKDERVQSDSAS